MSPDAHLKVPFPSGTPSFLFKKVLTDGTEYTFGATMDLLDWAEIFDGQSAQATLHVIGDLPPTEFHERTEIEISYNLRSLGTVSIQEVVYEDSNSISD